MGLFEYLLVYGLAIAAVVVALAILGATVVAQIEERGVRKDRDRRKRLAETYRRRPE